MYSCFFLNSIQGLCIREQEEPLAVFWALRNGCSKFMGKGYRLIRDILPLRDLELKPATLQKEGHPTYTSSLMLKTLTYITAVKLSIRPAQSDGTFTCLLSCRGAGRVKIIYSLMGACKMNKVNPLDWLSGFLARMKHIPSIRSRNCFQTSGREVTLDLQFN